MSKELPREIEQRINEMTEMYRRQLQELWSWILDEETEEPATAIKIEQRIREWQQRIGRDMQAQTLGSLERHRRKGKQRCPSCQEEVYWSRYEKRNYISSLGEVVIERAYYHHRACHTGWVPLDEQLQLGSQELSPLVQEMVGYLGAWMPFAAAAQYLAKYHGIHISHDTANNTTVQIGEALQAQQQAAVQAAWEKQLLPASEVEYSPKHLYISADGIHHLLPSGESKEIKVAAVYETEAHQDSQGQRTLHAVKIEYVVATNAEDLARAAYLLAVKRGVEHAEQILVVGDGANWIWNRVATMFPPQRTTEIVDFYHASEYLWDAAKAIWGAESAQTIAWGKQYCHTLKHEGPQPVLRALRALPMPNGEPPLAVSTALTYFENQQARMDYPTYRAQGKQIGSGTIESGVKQVVGVRLNQSGMRWNAHRAEAVAHARAAILSNRWDAFWNDFQPPPRQYHCTATAA